MFRPHCPLSISQGGYMVQSQVEVGSLRSLTKASVSGFLRRDGRRTMFRKATFLLNGSSLECYWCLCCSLPPKGQTPCFVLPSKSKGFLPLPTPGGDPSF